MNARWLTATSRIVFSRVLVVSTCVVGACGGKDEPTRPARSVEVPADGTPPPSTPFGDADEVVEPEEAHWVASHQSADGRWEAAAWDRWRRGERVGGQRLPGIGSPSLDVAVTSLALMAYSGAGYTSASEGLYGAVVAWGLHALLKLQDSDGAFGDPKDGSWPVNQGLAIFALTEQAEMLSDARLAAAVRIGVRRAQRSRAVEGDRWTGDHVLGGLPPFAWIAFASRHAVLAAKSEKSGGDGHSATGLESDKNLAKDRAEIAAWVSLPDRERSLAKLGVALAFGDPADKSWGARPDIVAAATWLAEHRPVWEPTGVGVDSMGWWLGTLGLFAAGGDPWRRWESAMKTAIIDNQHRDGSFCELKGSWDPIGAGSEEGGRVYMTLTCALSTEIWYRYDKVLGIPDPGTQTQPEVLPKSKPGPIVDESKLPRRRYTRCP